MKHSFKVFFLHQNMGLNYLFSKLKQFNIIKAYLYLLVTYLDKSFVKVGHGL